MNVNVNVNAISRTAEYAHAEYKLAALLGSCIGLYILAVVIQQALILAPNNNRSQVHSLWFWNCSLITKVIAVS